MDLLVEFLTTLQNTVIDVLPILSIILGFQLLVIHKPIPHIKQVGFGFIYVLMGLALFLLGLEKALFPLGKMMAEQLTAPEFIHPGENINSFSLVRLHLGLCFCCCDRF